MTTQITLRGIDRQLHQARYAEARTRGPGPNRCVVVLVAMVCAAMLGPATDARAMPTAALTACPQNQLANPNFEEGFAPRTRPEELVANGWEAWYETLPGVGGSNYAPRYVPRRLDRDGPGAVLQGMWAQELATEGATHIGGLAQRVDVPPKSQVLAHAYVRAWSGSGSVPGVSDPPGLYSASLGIDPLGGLDPHASGIEWTAPVTVTAGWQILQVERAVEGPRITLFLKGDAALPLAHHVAHWDAACLRVLGPAGVPTPTPTLVPRPTRTPRPGEPSPTPGLATRQAEAASLLAGLLATASAQAALPGPVLLTRSPNTIATAAPADVDNGGVSGALARNLGLVFLGLGALAAGMLLAAAKPSSPAPPSDKPGQG